MALNAFTAIAGDTAEEAEQSEGLTEALQLQYMRSSRPPTIPEVKKDSLILGGG